MENQMQINGDPIEKLYKVLKQKGAYTKSIDDFRKQYASPEEIDKVYKYVSDNKLYTKSKQDFYGQYFPSITGQPVKKKEATIPSVSSPASASAAPSTSSGMTELGGGIPATEQDIQNIQQQQYLEKRRTLGTSLPATPIPFNEQDPLRSAETVVDAQTKRDFLPIPKTETKTEVVIPLKAKQEELQKEADKVKEEWKGKVSVGEARKEKEKLKNFFRYNQNLSSEHLAKSAGISNPADIYNLPIEQIQSFVRPGNKTDEVAFEAVRDAKFAKEAIKDEGDIVEAAINFTALQDEKFAKQLDKLTDTGEFIPTDIGEALAGKPAQKLRAKGQLVLGNATLGRTIFESLSNPIFQEEVKKNPQLYTQLKERLANILVENNEFGRVLVGNKIAQKLEDLGMNNPVMNIVTKKEADKAVEDLMANNEMTLAEKRFYDEYIRPRLGLENFGRSLVQKPAIETPGFVESTLKSGIGSLRDFGQGIAEFTTARDVISGERKALSEDLERENRRTSVTPKSLSTEMGQSGCNIFGQVIATGGMGKGLNYLGLIKNPRIAIGLTGAIQAYGMYMPEARKIFPGEKLKQTAYTYLMSGINFVTEQMFQDQKVVDGLLRGIKSDVKKTIQDFTEKNISREAASAAITNSFVKAVNNLKEAAPDIMKATGQNVAEEIGAEFLGQITTGIFEKKPLDQYIKEDEIAQVARMTFLGSPVVSALAARSDMKRRRAIAATQMYQMGLDADVWRKKMQEVAELSPDLQSDIDEKMENLEKLQGIVSYLETRDDLTLEKKAKTALLALDKAIKEEKAKDLPNETLKNLEKENIKKTDAEIEKVISEEKDDLPELNIREEPENPNLSAAKEILMGKLERGEIKGSYADMAKADPETFIRDIAEQAQNVGQGFAQTDDVFGDKLRDTVIGIYGEDFINAAVKAFPAPGKKRVRVSAEQLESLQPKTEKDAVQEQTTDEVDVRQQAGDGGTMGEGDAQPTIIAEESEGKGEGKEKEGLGGAPPISEPPPKRSGVFAERPATQLSFRGLQDVANEFTFEDVSSRERKSDVQLRTDARATMQEWADKGDYAKNVTQMVQQAEKGLPLSDEQRVILEQHLANVIGQAREMDKMSKEYDEKLREIKRLKDAGQIARSAAGAALRIPPGGSRPMETLEDWFIEEMDDTASETLTPEQKQQVKQEFDKFQKAEKAYKDKIAALEEQVAKMEAEKKVKEEKKKSAKTKKTKDDYSKERKEIVDSIKDKLKKSRGQLQATPIPYAQELIAIAPDVARLVKSYVEQGIVELSDLVKKIHADLKDDIPGIQEKDVRDVIAGKYNEKKPTRNQVTERIYELRTEAKLLGELERLQAGLPKQTGTKRINTNARIKDLKDKIKSLKPQEEVDAEKLKSLKSRYRNEIASLQAKIAAGDFGPDPKKEPIKLDAEAKALKDELIKVRDERMYRRMKNIYAQQTKFQKGQRYVMDVLNVPRSLMASLDFSAILRQGILPSLAHPIMASRAAKQMFQSGFSQKHYDRWMFDLEQSPRFELMKKTKLGLTDQKSPSLQAREEEFMSNLTEKIPLLGRLVKGSNRAYGQYLNKMRADLFNRLADQMEKRGVTWQNNPEAYKQMAKFVNNATGRGDLHPTLEKAAPLLNTLFFSPRLLASRINMLTYLGQLRFYYKVPPEVRKEYFRELVATVAIGITVLKLFEAMGAEVEDDWRSSDYGKIKYGDTRWDIWGGFQPYARIIGQLATGERKSTKTGKIQKLDGEGAFGDDRGDVIGTFFRGKLSPLASMTYDIASGKNIIGEKVDVTELESSTNRKGRKTLGLKEYALEHLTPLSLQGIMEALDDQGTRAWFTVGIPSAFGVGTQTY